MGNSDKDTEDDSLDIERNEKGQFVEQGEQQFTSEEARKYGEKYSWQNKREQNLKRLGLWEKYKDE